MIDERDRGFLLGDGVFETLLVANKIALWRTEHQTRMKKAARKLDIAFDGERIETEITSHLERIDTQAHVMRLTLSRGVTQRGLAADSDAPTLVIAVDPFDVAQIGKSVSLATSGIRRNPSSVTDRHKTTSYANNVFAAREARTKGADDALMFNQDGLVACTSIANIFMISDGKLVTPPEQDGALPGIMRRFLIDQFAADVRSIDRGEIEDAQGLFITNSLRFIASVTQLDGKDLPRVDTRRFMDAMLEAAQGQCGVLFKETTS